jgi:formylglycine-generating enzyme required for sulfatase activity
VRGLGGGVSEWTGSETLVATDSLGRGGTTVKVIRGGNWSDTDADRMSSAARSAELPSRRDARIGFRCASDP